MKVVYPVVFTDLGNGYMAYVPDVEINTQGDNLAEAIAMARGAIGLMGIDMQDDGKNVPPPAARHSYHSSQRMKFYTPR